MTVCRTSRQRSKAQKKIENFLNYRLEFSQTYNIFQPSQVTVKRNAVFYFGFFAPFLFRLFSAHERKERAADMPSVKYAVVYSF